MGCLAPGEMFDNMLQLLRFSVNFERILNTNNSYFDIKIMISAAHMLEDSWTCSIGNSFGKNAVWCVLMFLSVFRHIRSPRPVPSHAICGPTQVRFLAS